MKNGCCSLADMHKLIIWTLPYSVVNAGYVTNKAMKATSKEASRKKSDQLINVYI